MHEDDVENLIRYVRRMSDFDDDYENERHKIQQELNSKGSEVSETMSEIHSYIHGDIICSICGKEKLYMDSNETYYCPKHG